MHTIYVYMCTNKRKCHSLGKVNYIYELLNTTVNLAQFSINAFSSQFNNASEGTLCCTWSPMSIAYLIMFFLTHLSNEHCLTHCILDVTSNTFAPENTASTSY